MQLRGTDYPPPFFNIYEHNGEFHDIVNGDIIDGLHKEQSPQESLYNKFETC
jgi:hypothetical protein